MGTKAVIQTSKPILHRIEYVLLLCVQAVLGILPRKLTLWLGGLFGMLLYHLRIERSVAEINIRYTGFWTEKEQILIIKKLYKTVGRYGSDFLRPSHNLPPYVTHNFEIVDSLFTRGKGIIVLLAHFGNWEMLAAIYGSKISNLSVLAKPMRNRVVESWLSKKRAATGIETIYQHQALRKALSALKRNGMVALLIDQHSAQQGTMAPFLGKQANTIRTVAGLLLKTDCGILPTYAILNEKGSYEIFLQTTADLGVSRDNHDAYLDAYQAEHNRIISEWIRQYPEHWFGWFHHRFREFVDYKTPR